MIHHFLASAIITAVTNLYLLAPLKDVLNVTVSSKSYCFNWINSKKNKASQMCALNRKLCWSPGLSELPSLDWPDRNVSHQCKDVEFTVVAMQRKVFQLVAIVCHSWKLTAQIWNQIWGLSWAFIHCPDWDIGDTVIMFSSCTFLNSLSKSFVASLL